MLTKPSERVQRGKAFLSHLLSTLQDLHVGGTQFYTRREMASSRMSLTISASDVAGLAGLGF